MTGWWSSVRPYRFELGALILVATVGMLFAGGLALRLLAFGLPTVCLGSERPESCIAYARATEEYGNTMQTWQAPVALVGLVFPSIAALLLGLALVGKEIDQRTTVFAWSMSPSRVRWLSNRVVPAVAVTALVTLVSGGLADVLQSLRDPSVDAAHSFEGFGMRGVPIMGIGLAALGMGLLVGGVVGRILPALLVCGAVMSGTLLGVTSLNDVLLRSEATIAPSTANLNGARVYESFVQTAEGEVITWDEAYGRYGEAVYQLGFDDPSAPPSSLGLTMVVLHIPGEAYPMAALRLALLQGAAGIATIAVTYLVVVRRRP